MAGPPGIEDIQRKLLEEKVLVEQQLSDYGAAVGADRIELPVDEGGFADSAQATAERSELLSVIDKLRINHAELSAALARVEDGTYGLCERCGDEIPADRLAALPTARLCMACKQLE